MWGIEKEDLIDSWLLGFGGTRTSNWALDCWLSSKQEEKASLLT